MKTWKEIVDLIGLQREAAEDLCFIEMQMQQEKLDSYIENLTCGEVWESEWKKLKEILAPDEKGMKMLYCMLKASEYSYKKYMDQGISEKIFKDTMECFTRFAGEHKVSFGFYGFDRDFWTGRQLSLQLFRLGQLEFEKCKKDGENVISVHIPSDAALTKEEIEKSVKMSKEFFGWQDKKYVSVPYVCDSWLLSPALKELLPENSRILSFQNMFQVERVNEDADGFMEWVYKKKDIPLEELPENTSLQRSMKQYLLKGGKIGEGFGRLK